MATGTFRHRVPGTCCTLMQAARRWGVAFVISNRIDVALAAR
jgi:hypothetical protein